MNSRIFTGAELASLNKRLAGSKQDPTGIYAARVKPKILELTTIWFKKQRQLLKLVK